MSEDTTRDTVDVDSIDAALSDFAAGKPVVVMDSPHRENEGDLIMSAELATPEWVGFFIRYTSGYLCVPILHQRADELRLPQMVSRNQDSLRTDYTISVDAATGVSTGISATDRCRTIKLLADPNTVATDFVRPGHILPLRARPAGTIERAGHTEATIDLCRLAGVAPAGVLGELVHDSGEMQRADDCRDFADRHGLKLITVEDLRRHVLSNARASRWETYDGLLAGPVADMPTQYGHFTAHEFTGSDGIEHLVLTTGDVSADAEPAPVPVRVHSECLTGDVFGSARCDCGEQLHRSMREISARGRGAIVYLRGQEGRGIGLAGKLAAYGLQEQGLDTADANTHLGYPVDSRHYTLAAAMLRRLGITSVELYSNNPKKSESLEASGIRVVSRTPMVVPATPHNARYLQTKAEKMGHDIPAEAFSAGTTAVTN